MKTKFILSTCLLLLLQSAISQTAGSNNNWTVTDRSDFIRECITSAGQNMNVDSATSYCNCMLPKVEAKYPKIEDAGNLTAEVLATPEWKKMIADCMQSWTNKDKADFIRECIATAKQSLGEEKASFYCNCMQVKVEEKYPTVEEAGKITDSELQSESFQKMIKDCMGGWTGAEKTVFTNDCIKEAKKTMSDLKARNYCDCALSKIELRLPVFSEAQYLIPDKINSPYWKQILLDCNK
ncbi:hypothetical protein CAP36_07405 [Chitinophagaceae bacterium IBVUCB2]|nr:hypothetical protein CAP36_07405 [Chitinophagaceae bacterium IBVUCB2]